MTGIHPVISPRAEMSEKSYLQAIGGGTDVRAYLGTVTDYKTELNYFHQLLKTNLPQFKSREVGK